ncbi:pyrroloquinoline quinone precursor peptide PqqA [Jiella mangrovi]|nr:pyrroloquinoline quinone precursor peptide PqqA [Jiella mangrovi]MBP0615880.1 pyrroloquinoline quinone precursor peptide PqqA [Jiella mangrovi]
MGETIMAWNKPVVTEICMAMEINGYMPVEF